MKYTLLILTLNEIEGLKVIMPQVYKNFKEQILVVDGGSNDGTLEFLKKKKIDHFVQSKPGLGNAYKEGLNKCKGDFIILFSPDGNSDASRLGELMLKNEKENLDIVIVSRYKDWASSDDDDLITGFGNWMFTKIFNFLYKEKVTDLLVIYRCFKKKIVNDLKLDHEGISWTTKMMCRAAKKKLKIGEIPGNEPSRIGGIRKMNPLKNGIAELFMLIKEYF